MKLLDLYCGAGGASMGYSRAGFTEIVGVDIKHQPRYPFKFIQADALEYLAENGHKFDVITGSPPCQAYTVLRAVCGDREYPDLVNPTRHLMIATGKPYVIENVPGAPLINPVMLCGTYFGLQIAQATTVFPPALTEEFSLIPIDSTLHADICMATTEHLNKL